MTKSAFYMGQSVVRRCGLFLEITQPRNHSSVRSSNIYDSNGTAFRITGGDFTFAGTHFSNITSEAWMQLVNCSTITLESCTFQWNNSLAVAFGAANSGNVRLVNSQFFRGTAAGAIGNLTRSVLMIVASCMTVRKDEAWEKDETSLVYSADKGVYDDMLLCAATATASEVVEQEAYAIATVVVFFFCFSVLFIGLIVFVFCKARNEEQLELEVQDGKETPEENDIDLPSD
jgi:hypothetical protein